MDPQLIQMAPGVVKSFEHLLILILISTIITVVNAAVFAIKHFITSKKAKDERENFNMFKVEMTNKLDAIADKITEEMESKCEYDGEQRRQVLKLYETNFEKLQVLKDIKEGLSNVLNRFEDYYRIASSRD